MEKPVVIVTVVSPDGEDIIGGLPSAEQFKNLPTETWTEYQRGLGQLLEDYKALGEVEIAEDITVVVYGVKRVEAKAEVYERFERAGYHVETDCPICHYGCEITTDGEGTLVEPKVCEHFKELVYDGDKPVAVAFGF